MSSGEIVDEVVDGVFVGRGTDVNFYLLREGTGLTLIDAGYPGDVAAVESAIAALGRRPQDVQAVLITHAHIDHIGATNHLHDRYGVPTWTSSTEVAHAHRDYLEQARPLDVARNAWRPGVLSWAMRVVRRGATRAYTVAHAQPFPTTGVLDLPGRPQPVETPGHTSGHTAYLLAAVGAVISGDGLVTAHPLSRVTGPQTLPALFNHGDAIAGLVQLADLDADLLLPGHGDPLRVPIGDAVRIATQRCR